MGVPRTPSVMIAFPSSDGCVSEVKLPPIANNPMRTFDTYESVGLAFTLRTRAQRGYLRTSFLLKLM